MIYFIVGRIFDFGIKDFNNMGAVMVFAVFDIIMRYFFDIKRSFEYYDMIIIGDLGYVGRKFLEEFFKKEGISFCFEFFDCGILMFDLKI